jgi:hypothetical protein
VFLLGLLRRRFGNSFLGGGFGRGGYFRGCGSFVLGGIGTTAATASVTGAVLVVCDCWKKWWDDWWNWWDVSFYWAREGAPSEVDQWELAELEPHSEMELLLVRESPHLPVKDTQYCIRKAEIKLTEFFLAASLLLLLINIFLCFFLLHVGGGPAALFQSV